MQSTAYSRGYRNGFREGFKQAVLHESDTAAPAPPAGQGEYPDGFADGYANGFHAGLPERSLSGAKD
ncbi:hypothetical protein OHB26_24015 [Nocardia sp. NBC_01503]|uniref:hypothetical protein n=1 Tax=Nocardia sp. NBC_01503 TaxID=2975997 RepID=UPI002E7B93D7|nr:hypothetical protein [Nocardia sp. NBC_01503]WTL30018.1 hypothetical protein OHB26_24015 [Nocardia sp. NBC_01503]